MPGLPQKLLPHLQTSCPIMPPSPSFILPTSPTQSNNAVLETWETHPLGYRQTHYSVEGETETNNSDCGQSNGKESEDDIIDTEGPDVVGSLTYGEHIEARVALLRDFADGLEYQLQFGDSRMLDCLEQEGIGFFRMAESCLSHEHRLNSTRGASPTTWEKATSSALFYRT